MDRRPEHWEDEVSRRRFLTTAVIGGAAAVTARSARASQTVGAPYADANRLTAKAKRLMALYGGEFGAAKGDEHGGL